MKPIRYHRLALREYQEESRYYKGREAGLELNFQQEILATEERLRSTPLLFPLFGATRCRGCPVKRYPFTIYFAEDEDRVFVYAVVHHKRQPGYWLRRLRRP